MAKKQVALKTTGTKKATIKTRLVLKTNKTATAMKSANKNNLVTAKKPTAKNVKLSPSDSKSVFGTDSSGKDDLDKIIESRSKKDSKSVSKAGESKFVRGRVKTAKTGINSLKVKKESPSSPKKSKKEQKPSVSNQISQKADTKSISEELTKLIKKLEVKKVGGTSKSPTDSKPRSSKKKQKITAKSQNYTLAKNIKYKTTPVVDLFDISKKNEYGSTDIILGILELGLHHQCYILPNSPKSTSFWEEIVQFNELKRLFQFLRPDTLKKYWRHLSYKNSALSAINLLKKYKNFLDEKKPKVLTIIAGIQNYSEKKITDFEDFIVNQHKYKALGFPMEQEALLAGKRKMSQISKIWRGNVNPELKNYFGSVAAVKNLEERDEAKRIYDNLRIVNMKENRKLFRFTEEDKFVFNCVDNVIDVLCKECKDSSRDLALRALKVNTFNIPQTYEYLKKPNNPNNEKYIFNDGDDHVIRYMKNTNFYKELVESKTKENVENREYFLS